MPLGQPGKARQSDDPQARRPAKVITLSGARGAFRLAEIPLVVTTSPSAELGMPFSQDLTIGWGMCPKT